MAASNQNVRPIDADENNHLWFPTGDAERDAVREQLGRILASELFANSKRYPGLLRYIVEETLAGRASSLKERTLGVDVFGRDSSYDSNADPVVRTSAAQVRRRLVEYYGERGHEAELRIELAPGSYVPLFRRSGGEPDSARETVAHSLQDEGAMAAAVPAPDPKRSRHWLRWAALLCGSVVLVVLVWLILTHWLAPNPVTKFWGPVWSSSSDITICVPGNFPIPEYPTQTSGVALPDREPGRPLTIADSMGLNSMTWPDATVLYSLTGFLQGSGHRYRVRRERDLPFADLRSGPAVMVGGPFNNQWLGRLTRGYRFGYQRDDGATYITDSRNPSHKSWRVKVDAPYSSFDVDYGIFSRAWDSMTEHWVVVASGLASYGSIAAGDFLTNPRQLAILAQHAPRGWERKNIQVVIATKVLKGNAGPPQILAIHVW